MNSLSHNVKFCYYYRDFANYRKHGEVIFSNPNGISLHEIDELVSKYLIADDDFGLGEMKWFLPSEWGLDTLYFDKWDYEIDHPYHTYDEVMITDEPCTSEMSIDDFLEIVKKGNNRLVM